jgi:hypothetical protein
MFLEGIEGGNLDSAYVRIKAGMMIDRSFRALVPAGARAQGREAMAAVYWAATAGNGPDG